MLPAPRSLRPPRLLAALCGMLLIGGGLGPSLPAQAALGERPSSAMIQHEAANRTPASTPAWQESTASPEDHETVEDRIFEVLVVVFIFVPILTILLSLLLAFPTVLLAVSLVMDGGCLRFILFGMGWLCAIFYGLLTGAIVGEELLGIELLIKPIFYVFMWGYPVAAYWGYKKLEAMPQEQYRAWDQTLTGGAFLGFGAGSVAGLLRPVGSGFGGFGGGSFGGGGASGSWSGASGATGGVSSTAAGGTSSTTAGTATTTAAGSSEAAAVASGAAPGVDTNASSSTSSNASGSQGLWTRLRQWFQKFQWYHGLVFILVTLVFVPLGLGAMQALQNTKFLIFVLVCVVLYSGYKLLHRHPDASQSVLRTISSFRGGEASSSWS